MDPVASVCNPLERMLIDETAKPTSLRLQLLKSITNNFSNDLQIGTGGFAVVYKGLLQNGTVAVKKLIQSNDVDDAKFQQEVDNMLRVKHKNIVRFMGYCSDTQGILKKFKGMNVMAEERQRFLCFEFLPKGTPDKYIRDASEGLDWLTRYQIIKGICEGLNYLHQQKIVHLDLKPANVLLDHSMVPKIADFGLSRCFDEKKTRTITKNMHGTIGYMAPESHDGLITFKSDIYSLGIIIIEILTGHKGYPRIDNVLGSWSTRFETSVGDTLLESVQVCAEIGLECTEFNPDNRPDIRRIIERLAAMESKYGFMKTDLFTSSASNPKSTGSDGKVKLEIMGRVNSIPSTTGYNCFPVLVRVTAPLQYTENSRAGLDLVAVLAVSDRLLDSVKKAMMFIMDKLGPYDRLSIVFFKDGKTRSTELSIPSHFFRERVRTLMLGGGNDLIIALATAAQILRMRRPEERSNRVGRIIFLSDREDSVGPGNIIPEFPVETFGLGADHDPDDLFRFAFETMGLYSYVDQDLEKINDAFAQSLGGLTSVTAIDIQIKLQTHEGVTISNIKSGNNPMSINLDKRYGTIQVPDLYAGEKKNFIVHLNVPQGEQNLFMTVNGSYRNPMIRKKATKVWIDDRELAVLRPKVETTPPDRIVCPDVAAELNRSLLLERILAMAGDEHPTLEGLLRSWEKIKDSEDGRSALQSTLLALDKDIAEILHAKRKSFLLSWLTSHICQRATTKGYRT